MIFFCKEADYGEDFNGAVGAIVFNSLCPSVEALLTDGLLEGRYLWMIVQSSVTSGNNFFLFRLQIKQISC